MVDTKYVCLVVGSGIAISTRIVCRWQSLPDLLFVVLGLLEAWLLYQVSIRWRKNRAVAAICLACAFCLPFLVTHLTLWGELNRLLAP
jgi:hypothetical protein